MKLTILQPVRHDGKRLQPGDVVNVKDDAQARALVACAAAEAADAAPKRSAEAEPATAASAPADAADQG